MGKASSGANAKYYFTIEDSPGVIAPTAPVFYPIRFNTSSLTRETTQIDSEEINPARQRPPSRQGTYNITGEMLSEMSSGSFDELLAIVMQSEWNGGAALDGTGLYFLAADNSINDPLGRFVDAGFTDAMPDVNCKGATNAGNNFTGATATTVTANKIILTGPTIVDESDQVPVIIWNDGDQLTIGSFLKTVSILEIHDDVGITTVYKGCRVNEMPVAAPLNSAAQLTFGYIGEAAEDYTIPGDAVFNAQSGTPMMVTTSGYLNEEGLPIDYATDYNFTLSNNMEALFALFAREAYAVSNGVVTVEGSMSAYLPDGTLLGKYLDETTVDHVVEFQDNEAPQNFIRFSMPSVNYTQLDKPVDGPGAVIQNYTLSAGYLDNKSTLRIERGQV